MAEQEIGDEMVAFRLGPRDRAGIQRLVEAGEFRNRSDFLRYAVKAVLAEHGEGTRARTDVELEGVELPQSNAAKGNRPVRTPPRKGVGL